MVADDPDRLGMLHWPVTVQCPPSMKTLRAAPLSLVVGLGGDPHEHDWDCPDLC
jgi:hypothetical protein